MATNQGQGSSQGNRGGGNQGGGNQGGGSTGSDDRGFAGMDDQQQREIARKGGEASARSQDRDDQGQFTGNQGGSGNTGGSSGSKSR